MCKPVISFYNNQYIYSDNYKYIPYNGKNWINFLEDIDKEYYNNIKIIKLSYNLGELIHFGKKSGKKMVSNQNLIDLFILNEYKIIDNIDLLNKNGLNFQIDTPLTPLIDREYYNKSLKKILNLIKNGVFYQINYTIPFKGLYSGDHIDCFYKYHQKFSGKYHIFLPFDNGFLISMSPELFIEKKGDKIVSQPIKGTAKNSEEGLNYLKNSEKESAELSMIVDLIRNDLNSVSIDGDKVNFHREIMDIGNILHTYSEIEVETDKQLPYILSNILPGGSISGCPKRSAMEYIDKLEPYSRGYYTGSAGWWYKDQFSLNILIRSIYLDNKNGIYYHSGGGIVYDSDIESEYKEVLLKAEQLIK